MGKVSMLTTTEKRLKDWNAEEQLVALHETHGLSGEALQTWCRKNGIFAHNLTSWKTAFCADGKVAPGTREIRVLKDENEQLKRELARLSNGTTMSIVTVLSTLLPPQSAMIAWMPRC